MADMSDVIRIIKSLHACVTSEPGLSAFVPAVDAILSQAEAISKGDLEIQPLDANGCVPIGRNVPVIPTKELAILLRRTFDELPTIDTAGTRGLDRAYAILLRNAHVSILHAIFQQYPEILPRPSSA